MVKFTKTQFEFIAQLLRDVNMPAQDINYVSNQLAKTNVHFKPELFFAAAYKPMAVGE